MAPPPPASMALTSACMHRNTPSRLTAITVRHSSAASSPTGAIAPLTPAQFTAASRDPWAATIPSTTVRAAVGSATSRLTASAAPPDASIKRAVSDTDGPSMSAATTMRAPSAANSTAVALPMPEPAPVTRATLPRARPAPVNAHPPQHLPDKGQSQRPSRSQLRSRVPDGASRNARHAHGSGPVSMRTSPARRTKPVSNPAAAVISET